MVRLPPCHGDNAGSRPVGSAKSYPIVAQLVEQDPVKVEVGGSSPPDGATNLRKVIILKAKILLYDLEVSPTLGWTYGLYDTRVLHVEKEPIIMCFSYRWYGEKKTYNHRVQIVKGEYNVTEEDVVARLWDLFDEADIVVAHNANRFDNKVATAAFLRHGLTPPSPYKTVDTLRVARSIARFNSNSLNSLGQVLGLGTKTEVRHAQLWHDCLAGDEKAWKKMVKYNNQDVDLLDAIYERLLPYIKNHPNLGIILQKRDICAKCGSSNLQARGREGRKTGMVQRWSCNDCGGNTYSSVPDERLPVDERPNIVN